MCVIFYIISPLQYNGYCIYHLLNISKCEFCLPSVFLFYIRLLQHIAFFPPCSVKLLVFVMYTVCSVWGTKWNFVYDVNFFFSKWFPRNADKSLAFLNSSLLFLSTSLIILNYEEEVIFYKTGDVRVRRVRQPFLLWKSYKCYIFWECVFSLGYPACHAHALCCTAICGLPRSTIFFHMISEMTD